MSTSNDPKSERTRVKREPQRGQYGSKIINEILDAGMIAHVGFVSADGQPLVIPMLYVRDGNRLLIHGSSASRLLNTAGEEVGICVTVTIADGLVVARSAFNSSLNYRSVVVIGKARAIHDAPAKWDALRALTDGLVPGRWDDCRQPTELELKATWILSMPLDEASAKIRTGGPNDDEEDLATHFWAGVIPFVKDVLPPVPHDALGADIELPEYLRRWKKDV
ncbi:MAG TPA: pyridoxamine 5'-phosphate oxidase family protein [Candidatus Krumholzibacteria bacterium]|nr:pyridoxamine 5'-phosphate oxidase family protein [Candidatus Krumholzibacteria bacterium]